MNCGIQTVTKMSNETKVRFKENVRQLECLEVKHHPIVIILSAVEETLDLGSLIGPSLKKGFWGVAKNTQE